MASRPALVTPRAFGELTSASGSSGERQSRRECRLGDNEEASRETDSVPGFVPKRQRRLAPPSRRECCK